ncbi:uncharacterized protein AMSG_07063 [Thecamonas trahens ATCC 50062]|uniref:PPM-type phosphatase domain-containing protein n=1 Tax=Thecamonas trahens ATCC 50062 TaxID=461836 RepID=A0A0L0DFL1_THETB|nr:hypothetical protein AMSG_07063 [Thecamonas trahens ATCC 50062]KNC51074.1 hypothetical protein AMSG_07063 [Thecamonas trahens ATCC 50062]|eukprot:XP_013756533.1 hypothetical protein AMSG_07063 [Thecamonas trahens ATCC 50062]
MVCPDAVFFEAAQVAEFGDVVGAAMVSEAGPVAHSLAEVQVTTVPTRATAIGTSGLSVAVAHDQGKRKTMEDADLVCLDLAARAASSSAAMELPEGGWHALFAVFDGHSGAECAKYCADNIIETLVSAPAFAEDPEAALTQAFATLETSWLESAISTEADDGTTAVVAYLRGTTLWVANAGDSEAILTCTTAGISELTTCHNPAKNPAERERVAQLGGTVMPNGRLRHPVLPGSMFSIAVSKALGDLTFKHDQYTKGKPSGLTAVPSVNKIELTDDAHFVLMACDGLWDVMAFDVAAGFVVRRLNSGLDVQAIVDQLVARAIDLGSMDNVTALLIVFDP